MKELTGELFHLADGRMMLVHNEQEARLNKGEYIAVDNKVYIIAGVVASSRPQGKWSIKLEEPAPDD